MSIPLGLLGDVRKLAERERAIAGPANTNAGYGSSTRLAKDTTPKVLSSAQKLSTRAKGFAQGHIEPLPQFVSSSDLFTHAAPPVQPNRSEPIKDAPIAKMPTAAAVQENAFYHQETARRLSHLTQNPKPEKVADLSFVYEAETASQRNQKPSGRMEPAELTIAVPKAEVEPVQEIHNLSLKPTTRKEVALLKHTMIALLDDIGCSIDQEYPTEMHAFLAMIQEEQKIYDTVFQEIIRQVTINMVERGEVLAEVRRRYGNMFTKIPRHVKHLHTELVAQRKLNRRLTEELLRSKETTSDLFKELDTVRKHDVEVTKQAQDAQEKLISVLTQSDNTDEILEEYHKLYKMQRERLEEAVRKSENEKKMWIDAACNLALRIGQEHGITDLSYLQKTENSRLRCANHMIVIISNTNDAEMTAIESKIDEWRTKLMILSQTVIDDDHSSIDALGKIQRGMKLVLKNLTINEPKDLIERDHPVLKAFHIFDVKSLVEYLMKWVEGVTSVAVRFTSDTDLAYHEEIVNIRKIAEQWLEGGLKLLRRNERNTNSRDYLPLTDVLSKIGLEIEEWISKLEVRISGDQGVASSIIGLQNQLEDRYTTFSARDNDKPLTVNERNQLKEALLHWTEVTENLIGTLCETCEKEQQKTPLHVENWVSRVLDQVNTDTDVRNEENHKLHTLMMSWMVQLLVKSGKEKPSEAWDHEFLQLTQEISSFNMNLIRDSSDIVMVSDDEKSLRDELQLHSESWIQTAKRLLNLERKNAIVRFQSLAPQSPSRK